VRRQACLEVDRMEPDLFNALLAEHLIEKAVISQHPAIAPHRVRIDSTKQRKHPGFLVDFWHDRRHFFEMDSVPAYGGWWMVNL
jgi:hypothetical protein